MIYQNKSQRTFNTNKSCFFKEENIHDWLDRVSVPSPIAIDILMVRNGEGQSSHVPVFCVNFERHISTHITTSIKCYLVSLRYVYVPFTYI